MTDNLIFLAHINCHRKKESNVDLVLYLDYILNRYHIDSNNTVRGLNPFNTDFSYKKPPKTNKDRLNRSLSRERPLRATQSSQGSNSPGSSFSPPRATVLQDISARSMPPTQATPSFGRSNLYSSHSQAEINANHSISGLSTLSFGRLPHDLQSTPNFGQEISSHTPSFAATPPPDN